MNLNTFFAGIFALGVGVIIADSRKIYADGGEVEDEYAKGGEIDTWNFKYNEKSGTITAKFTDSEDDAVSRIYPITKSMLKDVELEPKEIKKVKEYKPISRKQADKIIEGIKGEKNGDKIARYLEKQTNTIYDFTVEGMFAKGGEVASNFFDDNPSKTHTANIHVVKDDQEIKIYSYDTLIAKRKIGKKTIELNTKKYSNTTTKLQNMLKREASAKGFSLNERGEF